MRFFSINKILVPIDFSNTSMNALQTAVAIAKKHDASLLLLHVFDVDNDLYPEDNMGINSNPEVAIKSLSRLAESVKSGDDIPCSIAYMTGYIPHSILETAKEKNTDLVVMGKNGNSGHRENFAGTNAYDVAKKSHCPVMLVPSGKMYESFNDVLFPARPVLSVFDKYALIKPIIQQNNATLHFLALRNPSYIEELHIISKITELLKRFSGEDDINTTMSYYFKNNAFAKHILDTIEKSDFQYDLLVISAELDANMKDYYLGEYAQQIIHQSQIPVMLLRSPKTLHSPADVIKILEASVEKGEAIPQQ